MLTEFEKKWLKQREENDLTLGGYYCPHCVHFKEEWDIWNGHCNHSHCRVIEVLNVSRKVLLDAAEFEARVSTKLVKRNFKLPCHTVDVDKCTFHVYGTCGFCHVKYARLAVEEEMK